MSYACTILRNFQLIVRALRNQKMTRYVLCLSKMTDMYQKDGVDSDRPKTWAMLWEVDSHQRNPQHPFAQYLLSGTYEREDPEQRLRKFLCCSWLSPRLYWLMTLCNSHRPSHQYQVSFKHLKFRNGVSPWLRKASADYVKELENLLPVILEGPWIDLLVLFSVILWCPPDYSRSNKELLWLRKAIATEHSSVLKYQQSNPPHISSFHKYLLSALHALDPPLSDSVQWSLLPFQPYLYLSFPLTSPSLHSKDTLLSSTFYNPPLFTPGMESLLSLSLSSECYLFGEIIHDQII